MRRDIRSQQPEGLEREGVSLCEQESLPREVCVCQIHESSTGIRGQPQLLLPRSTAATASTATLAASKELCSDYLSGGVCVLSLVS